MTAMEDQTDIFSNSVNKQGASFIDFDEASGLFQRPANGKQDNGIKPANGNGDNANIGANGYGYGNGGANESDDPFGLGDPFALSNGSPFHAASNSNPDWYSAPPVFSPDDDADYNHDTNGYGNEHGATNGKHGHEQDQYPEARNEKAELQSVANHKNVSPNGYSQQEPAAKSDWQNLQATFTTDEDYNGDDAVAVPQIAAAVVQHSSTEPTAAIGGETEKVNVQPPAAAVVQHSSTEPTVAIGGETDKVNVQPPAAPTSTAIVSEPKTKPAEPYTNGVQNDSVPHEPQLETLAPKPVVTAIAETLTGQLEQRARADSQKNDPQPQPVKSAENNSTSSAPASKSESANPQKKSTAMKTREARRVAATSRFGAGTGDSTCFACGKRVYPLERTIAASRTYHKTCARCAKCNRQLESSTYHLFESKLYCKPHLDEAVRGASVTQHYVRVLAQTAASSSSAPKRTSDAQKHSDQGGDDKKSTEGVVNGNLNLLADELEACRNANLKSVRTRFEAAANTVTSEVPNSTPPKPARESFYATRLSSNPGAPRRAVSMQNVNSGGEFSLASQNRPDIVTSSQNLVADELELCKSRAVTKQLIGKFIEAEADDMDGSSTRTPRFADDECPSGAVKRFASMQFSNDILSMDDIDRPQSYHAGEELPTSGNARKLAALFQPADPSSVDDSHDAEGIAV